VTSKIALKGAVTVSPGNLTVTIVFDIKKA